MSAGRVRDAAVWDPEQYGRFRDERARPFHDLLARMPAGRVRSVADLGCGTGELTRLLLAKWPDAHVWGVDRSAEMLLRARSGTADTRLSMIEADLRAWRPPQPLDRIVSNASLHWIPDHAALLEKLAGDLGPDGVLGVQMPYHSGQHAYQILAELIAEPRWIERCPPRALEQTVEAPSWYGAVLRDLGFEVELWETTYYHQLSGAAEIVEWLKGTTLRPLLTVLSVDEASAFLSELSSRLSGPYAAGPDGVVFPFRRLFFVARRVREPRRMPASAATSRGPRTS